MMLLYHDNFSSLVVQILSPEPVPMYIHYYFTGGSCTVSHMF